MTNKEVKCVIWGNPAEYFPTKFDGYDLYSARAGGRYQITRTAAVNLQSAYANDNTYKARLSRLIFESQNQPDFLRITSDLIEKLANIRALRPFEKAETLLRFIAGNTSALNVAGLRWDKHFGFEELDKALAAAELLNHGEIEAVLEYLIRKGFCTTKIDQAVGSGFVWLTLEGAEHVEAVRPRQDSDRAFVAMWFSADTRAAYELGIAPAIRDNAFQPIRIDQKEHNNKIDDEILSEIRNARFLVAYFTCGVIELSGTSTAVARGGVYFEAGFAIGLGIPVIWTVRSDLINHVHFDTRQYNHITWSTPEDLRKGLSNRIGAVIGKFRESQ
jgi:hypothetical protein